MSFSNIHTYNVDCYKYLILTYKYNKIFLKLFLLKNHQFYVNYSKPRDSSAWNSMIDKEKVLREIMKKPGNSICFECHAPLSYESAWASANLGVFICLNCSGVHRQLGTHVSFVRSCKLDKWSNDHLCNMSKIGNSNAAKFWEANICSSFNRSMNTSALTSFLISKYVNKEFVPKQSVAKTKSPQLHESSICSGVDAISKEKEYSSCTVESSTDNSCCNQKNKVPQNKFRFSVKFNQKPKDEATIVKNTVSCGNAEKEEIEPLKAPTPSQDTVRTKVKIKRFLKKGNVKPTDSNANSEKVDDLPSKIDNKSLEIRELDQQFMRQILS